MIRETTSQEINLPLGLNNNMLKIFYRMYLWLLMQQSEF